METTTNIEKSILVPTDFSEVCDNALNHAIELGKFLHSKVYVMHAIDSLSKSFIANENLAFEFAITEQNELEIIQKKLHNYVSSKNDTNVIPIIKIGNLFDSIEDAAETLNAQLIVLGTHGKIGFQKLFGSYALKVIDNSKIPVLIVHKNIFKNGYKDIIFPISLEEEDRQKTEYAVKIASVFNSTIHIFPKEANELKSKNKMTIVINQITSYFQKYNVSFKVVDSAEYGDTWDRKILNYSTSIDAGMILILSNPEKHSLFFDAKEENIIFNSAQIPVMCINFKKTKISSFWGGYSSEKTNVY